MYVFLLMRWGYAEVFLSKNSRSHLARNGISYCFASGTDIYHLQTSSANFLAFIPLSGHSQILALIIVINLMVDSQSGTPPNTPGGTGHTADKITGSMFHRYATSPISAFASSLILDSLYPHILSAIRSYVGFNLSATSFPSQFVFSWIVLYTACQISNSDNFPFLLFPYLYKSLQTEIIVTLCSG